MNKIILSIVLALIAGRAAAFDRRARSKLIAVNKLLDRVSSTVTISIRAIGPDSYEGNLRRAEPVLAEAQRRMTPDLETGDPQAWAKVSRRIAWAKEVVEESHRMIACERARRAVRALQRRRRPAGEDALGRLAAAVSALASAKYRTQDAASCKAAHARAVAEEQRLHRGRSEKAARERAAEESKVAAAARRKTAVTARFPHFREADALDPRKVAAAFREATTDMIYVVATKGSLEYAATDAGRCRTSSEGRFETAIGKPIEVYAPSPGSLPESTPLLLWSWTGAGAVLVTADAARYRATVLDHELERGRAPIVQRVPADHEVPKPLHHTCVDQSDVEKLEAAGALAAGSTARLAVLTQATLDCDTRIWNAAEKRFDAIDRANITESTRRNRVSQLRQALRDRSDRQCRKYRKAFERALLGVIEAWKKGRLETFAVATGRLRALRASTGVGPGAR